MKRKHPTSSDPQEDSSLEFKFSCEPGKKEPWMGPADGPTESDFQSFKKLSAVHPRYMKFTEQHLRLLFWRQNPPGRLRD